LPILQKSINLNKKPEIVENTKKMEEKAKSNSNISDKKVTNMNKAE